MPCTQIAQCLVQHPAPDGSRQAGFVGQVEKSLGLIGVRRGLSPAQLGGLADHRAGLDVDDGLVHEDEAAVLHGGAQVLAALGPHDDVLAHGGVEQLPRRPSPLLGMSHGERRVAEERFERLLAAGGVSGGAALRVESSGTGRADHQADAGRQVVRHPVDRRRLAQVVEDPLRHATRDVGRRYIGAHHHEFVAGEAGHGVRLPAGGRQARGGIVQEVIADAMSELLVDLAEAVEGDDEHGEQRTVFSTPRHGLIEPLVEDGSVGQTGELVAFATGPRLPARETGGWRRDPSRARADVARQDASARPAPR